jgi:GAF domain-containing protein
MGLPGPELGSNHWTPADFLLHGRYCEPDDIARRVEFIRHASESRVALLIAHRGRILFHSLLLLAHANPQLGNKWQARLLNGPRWRRQNRTPLQHFVDGEINERDLITHLRDQPPFDRIAGLLRGDVRITGHQGPTTERRETFPEPASVHLLLVAPHRYDTHVVNAALDDLYLMTNGSAAVSVHGNLAAERNIDREFDRISNSPHSALSASVAPELERLASFAQALLPSALSLTKSRLGNVYLADRDAETLVLIAHERNAKPRARIAMEDPESVVSWVYRRRRPMVINSIPDYLKVHPEAGVINVASPEGTPQRELAVPIIQQGLEGGTGTVIGVVNVEKLDDDDTGTGYSYRDVSILHSVAHRIALWRANSMVEQTSAALAILMKRSTTALEWNRESRHPQWKDELVPADAEASLGIALETLRSVYGLTRSYAATMRLLSPDRQRLVRFAAFPPERMHDVHPAVHVQSVSSVIAWVARTGTTCYLANVRDRALRKQYPGLQGWLDVGISTRSELCIPIFVSGRLVGVLDLESRFLSGYADSIGIAGAVAEQLGLAVQQSRRFHEQEVMSMSTATTANVHELGKLVDKLRDVAGEFTGPAHTELTKISDGIVQCSQSGAALPSEPLTAATKLVTQVLRDLELSDTFDIRGTPIVDRSYANTEALAFRSALAALLDNAYRNAPKDNPGCKLSWGSMVLGGRRYVTLLVMNNIGLAPDSSELRHLFRLPLRTDHSPRARLGAFTAGALVRSFGGDVFVLRGTPPRFIIGIDLPIDDRAADASIEEAA